MAGGPVLTLAFDQTCKRQVGRVAVAVAMAVAVAVLFTGRLPLQSPSRFPRLLSTMSLWNTRAAC